MSSSLDQIGPFTKSVEDAAIVFDAIRGRDPLDATSTAVDYPNLLEAKLEQVKRLTVGLPDEYFIDGTDIAVRDSINAAIESLKSLGVTFKKISLPHTKYALSTYYIIMPAEVSSNLGRFDGLRYATPTREHGSSETLQDLYLNNRGAGFGPESKRRIILGTFVLSSGYYDAYYAKAQKVRRLISEDFDQAFKQVDVVLTPTSPTPAFKLGEKTSDPLSMYLSDIFTLTANLAGIPGMSVPCNRTPDGLPVGMQLLGKRFREADILHLGMEYERLKPAK
jgi:aspartyl-tRNA(Asn)/glutamyl-tRNA(Gln) amidotransferase subunit A